MATYADVWKACEEAFGHGTRFDVDVSGCRTRHGDVRIEWTISHYSPGGGGLEQIEGSTADEVIVQIRALGVKASPGDVGEVSPG
jgi:hypothetical protein